MIKKSVAGMGTNIGFIAQYFTNPMIGGLYYDIASKLKGSNAFWTGLLTNLFNIGIAVYPDKYRVQGGNAIGEQTLVTGLGTDSNEGIGSSSIADPNAVTGALVRIADNIVPNPRVWTIHGYVGVPMEFSRIVQGGMGGVAGTIFKLSDQIGRPVLNTLLQKVIQKISEARQPFKFTTAEGETIPCLIKDYSFDKSAENQNFIECDLTIQEFRYIALQGKNTVASTNNQLYSSAVGFANSMGRTVARSLLM